MVNKSGSNTISSYAYTYYNDGNVAKKTENTGKVTNYTYDNLNRLKTETVSGTAALSYTYAYDLSSNRSSLTVTGDEAYTTSYTYDANNRLTEDRTYNSAEGVTDIHSYVYDNNGNQTRKYTSQAKDTNSGTTAIALQTLDNTDFEVEIRSYNAFNQMTSFKSTNGTTASYTYLPNGLRDSKTVNGTTTYFLWDKNSNILADFSNSSTINNIYTRGTNLIKNNSDTYYTYDGHGDIVQLTNSSGAVTKNYSYDAFGNETNVSANDTNPFRYCGQYYDTETGFIYLRARYYDPSVGSFITEDPIRDGVNWYSYCGGNPILFQDYKGEHYTNNDIFNESAEYTWSCANIGLTNTNFILAYANYSSLEASQKAAEWNLSVTYDNRADAYRHFIWNYDAAEYMGSGDASIFMTHHEHVEQIYVGKDKDGNKCYLTPIASLMDIYNNRYGRIYAAGGEYANHEEAFYAAENNGETLNSLAETKEYYNIPDTWVYGANDERYNNPYESVIIAGEISADPDEIQLVNPSDLKEEK